MLPTERAGQAVCEWMLAPPVAEFTSVTAVNADDTMALILSVISKEREWWIAKVDSGVCIRVGRGGRLTGHGSDVLQVEFDQR